MGAHLISAEPFPILKYVIKLPRLRNRPKPIITIGFRVVLNTDTF